MIRMDKLISPRIQDEQITITRIICGCLMDMEKGVDFDGLLILYTYIILLRLDISHCGGTSLRDVTEVEMS